MKIKSIAVAAAALCAAASASAMTTVVATEYTLSYDETTSFGFVASLFGSGPSTVGFTWSIPSSVGVFGLGGPPVPTAFALPSFTITANGSYSLSGGFSGSLGNLLYNEVGAGATTSASASASISFDGGPPVLLAGALTKTVIVPTAPVYENGYYSTSGTTPYGGFSTLSFSGGVLTLAAGGGTFANIQAQPQNELKFSFSAVPVPEPETYARMLAGLGLTSLVAHRRKRRTLGKAMPLTVG